jgi:hypothetical protein
VAGEVVTFPQAADGVEVRHLRAFVAVAEELNFSRAAARLYLSQPALSRQIRALERLVGCELLRRSTHRVELTVAGSALVDRARRLLADLDEAIATTQSVGGELANRMATMWAPVLEVASADPDIQEMRTAYESFLAQTAVPEDVRIRPVNAGGVSSLALNAADEPETPVLYLHGGGYLVGSAYGYRPLVGALVAAAGAGALVPDYRLAPSIRSRPRSRTPSPRTDGSPSSAAARASCSRETRPAPGSRARCWCRCGRRGCRCRRARRCCARGST